MAQIKKWLFSKKSIFLIGIIGFGLGSWSGYRTYDYLNQKGCYPLAAEVVSLDLPSTDQSTLRFIAVGDVGTNNTDQEQISQSMQTVCATLGCDFVLLLGDNFLEKGVRSVNDPLLESAFEVMYSTLDLPFFPVLGNHDVKGNVPAQVQYSLKNAKWNMPNYSYQFEVGPARFFALNTNCNLFGWYPLKDILSPRSSKWTFAFGHHPVFSSGVHGDNEWHIRWYWKNFLQEYVDFYLSGHNHLLEHLQGSDDTTEYIVSGAGGSHYRSAENRSKIRPSQANSLFQHRDTGFARLEVSETTVGVTFFNTQGEEIYHYTNQSAP